MTALITAAREAADRGLSPADAARRRKALDLPREALAVRAGVCYQTVGRFERGQRVSRLTRRLIREALDRAEAAREAGGRP